MKWTKISLICVIIGIGYLSLFPQETEADALPINDKIGHCIAYFILMINGGLIVQKKRWIIIGIASFLYSLLLEGLQYFIPGRSTDLNDLIANSLGIIGGLIVLHFAYKWFVKQIQNMNKFHK